MPAYLSECQEADSEQEDDDDLVQRFGSQGLPLSQARNALVDKCLYSWRR